MMSPGSRHNCHSNDAPTEVVHDLVDANSIWMVPSQPRSDVTLGNAWERSTASLHKHSRSTYSKAAERGRQIGRYWPDHHCTEVTGTQERHQRNDGIVVKTCHFRGQVHHCCEHRLGDSCNLPGIRVPKCTRWLPQRIHSETYCQVR